MGGGEFFFLALGAATQPPVKRLRAAGAGQTELGRLGPAGIDISDIRVLSVLQDLHAGSHNCIPWSVLVAAPHLALSDEMQAMRSRERAI